MARPVSTVVDFDEWLSNVHDVFMNAQLMRTLMDEEPVTPGAEEFMTFNRFLAVFADLVLDKRRPRVLVDSTAFKMDPAKMDLDWRNVNIIPKYNEAGVERFAFHVPTAMPAIGSPPAPDGPADFPTAWFASRREAIAWLRG